MNCLTEGLSAGLCCKYVLVLEKHLAVSDFDQLLSSSGSLTFPVVQAFRFRAGGPCHSIFARNLFWQLVALVAIFGVCEEFVREIDIFSEEAVNKC